MLGREKTMPHEIVRTEYNYVARVWLLRAESGKMVSVRAAQPLHTPATCTLWS